MSNENKVLARRWWEALDKGKALDIVEEVYAPDYVLHDPSFPEPVKGIQGVRDFVSSIVAAFPDARYTIENLIAEGDMVVQHVTTRGTHQGEFQGVPATGKPITVQVMVISRIANGRIVEEWQLFDALGMMQQMGVIPQEGQAGA
ncbi:MAG TPA: ester cyclase [Anaerolineales bacterium]|nr:ester cyclase [Anaerolineales bacterium]